MLALRLLSLIVVNRLVSLVVLMLGYVILLTAAKVSRDYLDIMNCGRWLELIVIWHNVTIGGLSLIIVSSLDPLGTSHHWLALDCILGRWPSIVNTLTSVAAITLKRCCSSKLVLCATPGFIGIVIEVGCNALYP